MLFILIDRFILTLIIKIKIKVHRLMRATNKKCFGTKCYEKET